MRFLGLEHLLYTSDIQEINFGVKNIKRILYQKSIANWQMTHEKTRNLQHTKMDLFCKTKTAFGISLHLSSPLSFKERRALTKFRTSSHNLPVETARYEGTENRSHRLCPFCNEDIGDEAHYLTECSYDPFQTLRLPMIDKVTKKFPMYQSMSKTEKTVFLLGNLDIQILSVVGRYAHEIMEAFRETNTASRN